MEKYTVLYRMFDRGRGLLYVGITGHLPGRINAHENDKPWWSDVRILTVEPFRTRAEALAAELAAIKTEGPLYNIAHAVNPIRHTKGDGEPVETGMLVFMERYLLGKAMLCKTCATSLIFSDIRSMDFRADTSRVIFGAIRSVYRDSGSVDVIAIANYLGANDLLDRAGGARELRDILSQESVSDKCTDYRLAIEFTVEHVE